MGMKLEPTGIFGIKVSWASLAYYMLTPEADFSVR